MGQRCLATVADKMEFKFSAGAPEALSSATVSCHFLPYLSCLSNKHTKYHWLPTLKNIFLSPPFLLTYSLNSDYPLRHLSGRPCILTSLSLRLPTVSGNGLCVFLTHRTLSSQGKDCLIYLRILNGNTMIINSQMSCVKT